MNKQPCSQNGCPANKVRNPRTGRCISIGKATYKKVCEESHLSPRKKKKRRKSRVKCSQDGCPAHKVRNPRTGRCITIGKKTYREICEDAKHDPFEDAKHDPFEDADRKCDTRTHSSDCIKYPPALNYVDLPPNSIIYR